MNWGIDKIRAGIALIKSVTDDRPSPMEAAAFAQQNVQSPLVWPWERGVRTVQGVVESARSINPWEAVPRFLTTGEAGTFRDFRNYFDTNWQDQLQRVNSTGDAETDEVLRERARSISQGAGFSE